LAQFGLGGDEPAPNAAGTCSKYADFKYVTSEELLEKVVHHEQPQDNPLLRQADFHAAISVRVFVNNNGHVVCAEVQKPAPGPGDGLNAVSLIAARKWRFRPLQTQTGKRVGMQGDLNFHLDH
jgi:hypothetical protein